MNEIFTSTKINHYFLPPTLKGYEIRVCTEPLHKMKGGGRTQDRQPS
jgi:hypothetical protein